MSITELNTIDAMWIDEDNDLCLVIYDDLPWNRKNDPESGVGHTLLLWQKLKAYRKFILEKGYERIYTQNEFKDDDECAAYILYCPKQNTPQRIKRVIKEFRDVLWERVLFLDENYRADVLTYTDICIDERAANPSKRERLQLNRNLLDDMLEQDILYKLPDLRKALAVYEKKCGPLKNSLEEYEQDGKRLGYLWHPGIRAKIKAACHKKLFEDSLVNWDKIQPGSLKRINTIDEMWIDTRHRLWLAIYDDAIWVKKNDPNAGVGHILLLWFKLLSYKKFINEKQYEQIYPGKIINKIHIAYFYKHHIQSIKVDEALAELCRQIKNSVFLSSKWKCMDYKRSLYVKRHCLQNVCTDDVRKDMNGEEALQYCREMLDELIKINYWETYPKLKDALAQYEKKLGALKNSLDEYRQDAKYYRYLWDIRVLIKQKKLIHKCLKKPILYRIAEFIYEAHREYYVDWNGTCRRRDDYDGD